MLRDVDWFQVVVAFVFGGGLIFCASVIAYSAVHLTISVWEMWRDWWKARRQPKN